MPDAQERAIAHLTSRAASGLADPSWRVTLHFHPDRLTGGRPILERMAKDKVYRSQFETGTSNGGLTAHPGGDRWRWENRIFAGAYDGEPGRRQAQVRIAELPRAPGRRLTAVRLGLLPAFRGRAGPDYVLLPGQLLRAPAFRCGVETVGAGRAGGRGRPGSARRLRRSPGPRRRQSGPGRRGAGPGPVLPGHRDRSRGPAAALPGRVARRLHPDRRRTEPPSRVPGPGVRGAGPGPGPRRPARSAHHRRRVPHRQVRRAGAEAGMALPRQVRLSGDAGAAGLKRRALVALVAPADLQRVLRIFSGAGSRSAGHSPGPAPRAASSGPGRPGARTARAQRRSRRSRSSGPR